MSSTKFRCENVDGVSLSRLKSGLQKAIRRGNAELALRCARELLRFGDVEGDAKDRRRIRTNFLHRLMIIFLEDVGQEDLWPRVEELRARAFEGEWPAAEPVFRWVALMAAAPKTRMCSHARAVASQADSAVAAKHYPSVAAMALAPSGAAHLIRLLRRGLVMRTSVAISAAWALAQSSEKVHTQYGRKAVWGVFETLADSAVGHEVELAQLGVWWAKELKSTKEAFLCWMLPVIARLRDDLPEVEAADDYEDPGGAPLVLPDYVIDMHVTGRKDYIRFALEGSHVENEDATRVNPRWKAFYMDLKFVAAGAPPIGYERHRAKDYQAERVGHPAPAFGDATSETGSYQLLVRAQLTTSNGKTDVYFAREVATGDLVVVKGPYARASDAKRAAVLVKWKRKYGLPAASARVVMLKPDRWPEGVPLGVRNRLDRAKPSPFLVATSLVEDPNIPMKIHQSKVWPETEVVDWDRLSPYVWLPMKRRYYSRQEKLDWVVALIYRYVIGLGDLADRNFMCAGGRLYSLDEDAPPREVRLGAELRKTKAAFAASLVGELWDDEIAPALARWGGLKGRPAERLEHARSSKAAALALFAC